MSCQHCFSLLPVVDAPFTKWIHIHLPHIETKKRDVQ
ncbi:hypothetical protein BVRB_3g070770 [Beta vulgaris subsp. vulgaris]|uniref:Uncharacterized protein n=1 Tax=Beta vulgaris subsp. vulgaris TaxID=3555 RepID=A0A0J8BEZ2_BETVV|nr:hypothetical protein BVRB_3g070770 [Beta vulgaris subsp. vulgaris]